MIHQSKPEYMTLINGRGFSLHQFTPPPFAPGIWQLVSWTETVADKTGKPKTISYIKEPVKVLMDLTKRVFILHFGQPPELPLMLSSDEFGGIALTHLKTGDLLLGNVRKTKNKMYWSLEYAGKKNERTVFLEFRKTPLNSKRRTNNAAHRLPSD